MSSPRVEEIEELAAENARLRAELGERARVEERLRQAQRAEIVARLAGGVAHDFNNLLTVVASHAAVLLETEGLAPEQREAAEEIAAAARRGAALTRQLLHLGRRLLVAPRVVSLNGAVVDLEKLLRRLLGEDVRLELALSKDSCPAVVDPGHLEHVVVSLAVNARDRMPRGGRLAIATEAGEGPPGAGPGRPGWVRLSVTDEGPAVAPGAFDRALDPTPEPGDEAAGLDLSAVRDVVRGAGGELEVLSAPGGGATFRVVLPRAAPEAGPPASTAAAPGRRVLLVEDDEVVRRVARRALERRGFEVLDAGSGAEAFALADRDPGPIHVLVSDVVLPRLNGFEVASRLRAARPGLRVVYVSGYGEAVLSRHGALEADLILLRKPFTPGDLAAKVEEALARPAPSARRE